MASGYSATPSGGGERPLSYSLLYSHHRDVRVVLRANRVSQLVGSPIPYASSSTIEPPVFGHGYLGCLFATSHGQVEILIAPFRNAARCDLGSFHEQEAQDRIPLLDNVAQPSSIPLESSSGTSPNSSRLAALESLGLSDDEHKGQCREGTQLMG